MPREDQLTITLSRHELRLLAIAAAGVKDSKYQDPIDRQRIRILANFLANKTHEE